MILHTVNKSIENNNCLRHCLRLALPGSAILLIEDGVYSALEAHKELFKGAAENHKLYLLEEDLLARGLTNKVQKEFELVSYQGFVKLCLEYSKVVSWS